MLRPIQLLASAEDGRQLQEHHRELKLPIMIVTGSDDQIVDVGRQSLGLGEELPHNRAAGPGNMVQLGAPFGTRRSGGFLRTHKARRWRPSTKRPGGLREAQDAAAPLQAHRLARANRSGGFA